jgi:hypothetical protein
MIAHCHLNLSALAIVFFVRRVVADNVSPVDV